MAKAKSSDVGQPPKTKAPTSVEILARIEALEAQKTEDKAYIERLEAALAKQAVEKELKPTPGLEIKGPIQFSPADPMDLMARPYSDTDKNSVYRWVNKHETIKPLRHFQGYETVKDKQGNVVRYMDMELAKMPRERHADMIVKPRDQKRAHHLDAIGASKRASEKMQDAIRASDLSEHVTGQVKITYDRKESLDE